MLLILLRLAWLLQGFSLRTWPPDDPGPSPESERGCCPKNSPNIKKGESQWHRATAAFLLPGEDPERSSHGGQGVCLKTGVKSVAGECSADSRGER